MERGALKGHGALLLANVIWGLNSPICKTVLLSPENPEGLNHFALTVYRLVGAFLLFWLASAFLPRERVAWRDLGGLFIASLFGIQLDQILFLWGLSLTSPINVSIIATTVPILTMILAMFFLREPITPLKTGGVLLGAAGAVLLILISSRGESGGGSIAGDIITLVSSVCYAIYLTACRKVILKYSPVTTMKWMFFFAAIVVVVLYHRPALEVDFPAVPARVWGGAAFAIVLSTFLAYLMVPIAPALPASDGYQHVQLRATRRLGAFHGRARARRFRIHESRRSGLHLPGRMAGNDVQITKRPRSGTSRQNDG